MVLIVWLVTFSATIVFTNNQPRIYEAKATFVMKPHSSFIGDEDIVKAVDTLSRRVEINTTYAEVANSKLIRNLAADQLELPSEKRKGLSASSKVIAGTNILEIRGRGREPQTVKDFTDAVGLETVGYISNLYDVFELEPLDKAGLPNKPVQPKTEGILALGFISGIIIGAGLVFASEYLRSSSESESGFEIVDQGTGAFTKSYLIYRLKQEMTRSRRNQGQLSLAILKICNSYPGNRILSERRKLSDLRQSEILLGSNLREEDVIARFGQDTFALLLPDLTLEAAGEMLEEVRSILVSSSSKRLSNSRNGKLHCAVGVVSYQNDDIEEETLLTYALEALAKADDSSNGEVFLYTKSDIDNQVDNNNGKQLASNSMKVEANEA